MLLTSFKGCVSRRDNQAYIQKNFDAGSDKQDVSSEDTNSANNISDLNTSNRFKKYGLEITKKENSLSIAVEGLKSYAGLVSDGSDSENKISLKDSEAQSSSKKLVFDKKISDLKEQVYTKSDWIKIIKDDDLDNTPNAEIYTSLRYGISNEMRPRIWRFLANVEKTKKEYPYNYYKELTKLKYWGEDYEKQIKLDVPRTFPEHCLFIEKKYGCEETLHRILRAYAKHDSAVGYVQGLNFIAGTLLLILHPANYANSKSRFFKTYNEEYEEDVFWVLVYLMFEKNWRSIYKPKFPKVQEMCKYFEKLMQVHVKEVYERILDNEFSVFDLFHQAFITLMTSFVPLSLSKRVIDMFLIDGEKLIFKVLIRALTLCQDQILQMNNQMKLHNFIKNEMFNYLEQKYKKKLYVLFPYTEAENF